MTDELLIGIVEPEDFSTQALSLLSEYGELSLYDPINDCLVDFINDQNVVFVRLRHYYGKLNVKTSTKLKFICTPTTGLNHIDVNYMDSIGVSVLSLKGEDGFLDSITATSEHAVGLLISLLRSYKPAFQCAKHGDCRRDNFKGYEINGLKVGLIGLGRIGKHLVKFLTAFSAEAYYYDISSDAYSEDAIRVETLSDLVMISDAIILCASYSKSNEGMVDVEVIDKMKNKYFVNISRGELVNEKYLLSKVESGHFSGVAIDVYVGEQDDSNNLDLIKSLASGESNFIYTPHMGGATYTSMQKTELFMVNKLLLSMKEMG